MPGDRSRRLIHHPAHGYRTVVAQQGRVILDRDFNALHGLTDARIAADALDFVGPVGTPDDGFRISLPSGSPPYWSPPEASPPDEIVGPHDFLISPGTMYIGGQRVFWPGEQDGRAITYSYFDQPDWENPDDAEFDAKVELVYLDVVEQEVGAVEDPDLLEVALGGPDTTQRLKLLSRVRRMGAKAADCATEWERAVILWEKQGLQFDPDTMRLVPLARLKVGFTEDRTNGDPCDPIASGGYLGADNQLIRVRTHIAANANQLVWGYDNASFLYRVTSVSPDRTMLTLASDPPDAFHMPQTGQVVELLRTAALMAIEPDETDPLGLANIERAVANATGDLHAMAKPYGPVTSGDPTNYVVLSTPISESDARSDQPLFLRVWQSQVAFTPGEAAELADAASGISTGVTVTITTPANAPVADGLYWEIAVRPSTPQAVYPEDLLLAPQPPDGPRRWACPLATITWTNRFDGTVTDCRSQFDNLVTLTRRKGGCCTVQIAPRDVTATTSLQTLIDRAAGMARTVTVCLGAGTYALTRSLRLDGRHEGLILESCGGAAVLKAAANADASAFADGLVVVTETSGVTLRGLTLHPPEVPLPRALLVQVMLQLSTTLSGEALKDSRTFLRDPFAAFGVRAVDADKLTLDACTVAFKPTDDGEASDLFIASVFLQGDCAGFTAKDCNFKSSLDTTYTPVAIPEDGAPVDQEFLAAAPRRDVEAKAEPAQTEAAPSSPKTHAAVAKILRKTIVDFGRALTGQQAEAGEAVDSVRQRADAAWGALAANRLAGPFDAANRSIVASAGIVAAAYRTVQVGVVADQRLVARQTTGGAQGDLDCSLGAFTLRDNRFEDLTFGVLTSAQFEAMRVQDNRVRRGVAGLWLTLPGFGVPQGAPEATQRYFPEVTYFEEYLLLYALASCYPLPATMLYRKPRKLDETGEILKIVGAARAAPDMSIFLTGNDIETRLDPQVPVSSTALLLGLYNAPLYNVSFNHESKPQTEPAHGQQMAPAQQAPPPEAEPVGSLSLVMSANRLRNSNARSPTALLLLPSQQPCAVTGNVIIPVSFEAMALWLATTVTEGGIHRVSVAGNALMGLSDLQQLSRGNAGSRSGWSPYNADPS